MTREEAIQILRTQYPHDAVIKEALGLLIPELRESEEEMTRKKAIAILKQQRDYWSYDGPIDKFPPATPRKDLVDAIDVALSYLEKQKEQKPAEWSDEDEKKIGRLRSVVNQLASYTDSLDVNGDYCEGDYAELDTWLKSLRPQPQGTYKLIVHNIYEMLKDKDFFDIPPSHRVSLLNDIRVRCKNADEQAEILDVHSWKPSEEQMNCLCAVVDAAIRKHNESVSGYKPARVLKSLYEQLKKLM